MLIYLLTVMCKKAALTWVTSSLSSKTVLLDLFKGLATWHYKYNNLLLICCHITSYPKTWQVKKNQACTSSHFSASETVWMGSLRLRKARKSLDRYHPGLQAWPCLHGMGGLGLTHLAFDKDLGPCCCWQELLFLPREEPEDPHKQMGWQLTSFRTSDPWQT